MTLLVALAALAALSGACRAPAAETAPPQDRVAVALPGPQPVTRPPALEGPKLAHASAFELVATTEGALLLWAAGPCSAGLHAQRFDADGVPRANASTIDACGAALEPASKAAAASPQDDISELAAAAGGGRLGVAWLARADGKAQVFGTYGPDDASALAPTLQLGAADASGDAPRGQLWLSGSGNGHLRVAWRAPPTACTGAPGSCAQLVSTVHPPATMAAGRRTDTREVPHPCSRLLVGSAWNQGVWYDAFCALDQAGGVPTTEVYAIKPEIFYAEASPALRGCNPLGLATSANGIAVFGDCPDGLRVQLIRDAKPVSLTHVERTLQCEAGRPILTLRDERGQSESFKLTGPRERIELWLPATLAGQGSRAVFTGRRLLIATYDGDHLGLKGYRCDGESVVSEPATML